MALISVGLYHNGLKPVATIYVEPTALELQQADSPGKSRLRSHDQVYCVIQA